MGWDHFPKGTSESLGCCCNGMDSYLFSLHMLLDLGGRGAEVGEREGYVWKWGFFASEYFCLWLICLCQATLHGAGHCLRKWFDSLCFFLSLESPYYPSNHLIFHYRVLWVMLKVRVNSCRILQALLTPEFLLPTLKKDCTQQLFQYKNQYIWYILYVWTLKCIFYLDVQM